MHAKLVRGSRAVEESSVEGAKVRLAGYRTVDARRKSESDNVRFLARRAKARSFSGCKSRPATFVPAGSNRSGRRGNEVTGASGVEGHLSDLASMQAVTLRIHRGNGDSMHTRGRQMQHGESHAWSSALTHRKPVTDRPGAVGWRRGPQY